MIEEFVDSALIIDDVESEVADLKKHLESKDIWVKYYSPDKLKEQGKVKNRKIIFLDLYLSTTSGSQIKGHISEIRNLFKKALGKDFGTYGIVLWSAHTEEINELKDKIKDDGLEYTLPIFIVGLDKSKYLKDGNYEDVFPDLNNEINKNVAANFFIQWELLVKKGKDNSINNIFSLVKDYKKQDQDLKYILFKLAQNYTGIPDDKIKDYDLHLDVFKSFSEMLYYEILNNSNIKSTIFNNNKENEDVKNIEFSRKADEQKIFSEINSKLLFDFININQKVVIPGNIYEIKENNISYKIEEIKIKKNKKEEIIKVKEVFNNIQYVIIEVTPPCDFAQSKSFNKSRILSGIIFDYIENENSNLREYFKGDSYYSEIYPIQIMGKDNPQMMVFDFRYFGTISEDELKDTSKYNIVLKVKDRLFADILQKLSSHIARLGLSIIH